MVWATVLLLVTISSQAHIFGNNIHTIVQISYHKVMHILFYRNTHFWRLVDSNFTNSPPLTCSSSTPTDGVTCKCLSHAHAHALAQCRLIEPLAVICDRPIHQVRQRTHRSASASATRRRRPDIPFPIQYWIMYVLRSNQRAIETFIDEVNTNNNNYEHYE